MTPGKSPPAASNDALPRWQELACDAALTGLDGAERAELDSLDAGAEVLLDLELAAGEIAARAYEARSAAAPSDEAMPAAIAERLFALAAAHGAPERGAEAAPSATDGASGSTDREQTAADEGDASGRDPAGKPREGAATSEPDAPGARDVRRSPPRGAQDETPADDVPSLAGRSPAPPGVRAAGDSTRARIRLQALRDRRREAQGRTSTLPWLLAAAAILLALFGWLRRGAEPVSITPPSPSASSSAPESAASAREALLLMAGTASAPWTATKDPSATGATGDVVWHSGVQRGYMRFRGLAPNNPAETQYQLWIFDGERDERYPVDGGVFNVGPNGEIVVAIEAKLHVSKPTLFAITVEKPGGVVVSSRERIVLTASLPPT